MTDVAHVRYGWFVTTVAAAVGCYSMTPQDRSQAQVQDALTAAAYAHLCRVTFDTDAGDVAAARADMRAAHAAADGILRRNAVSDAGAADAAVLGCPGAGGAAGP